MHAPVTLVVNVYERTWRRALQPGRFRQIAEQNETEFAESVVLINNVDEPREVVAAAEALVQSGEISGYRFVAEAMTEALQIARLRPKVLSKRGYFLDFGLAMAVTGTQPFILGWDPETDLVESASWVAAAVGLMTTDQRVGSVSPMWPAQETAIRETIRDDDTWAYNWGFSDQVFLVRRADVAAPIYRALAPASLARHAGHPFTFEARIEAWQRASGRARATHKVAQYRTNELGDVIVREGGYSRGESRSKRLLTVLGSVLTRLPLQHPRFRLP